MSSLGAEEYVIGTYQSAWGDRGRWGHLTLHDKDFTVNGGDEYIEFGVPPSVWNDFLDADPDFDEELHVQSVAIYGEDGQFLTRIAAGILAETEHSKAKRNE